MTGQPTVFSETILYMKRYPKSALLNKILLLILSPLAIASAQAGYQFTSIAGTTSFNSPYGLAVDASGNVYVADSFNDVVEKITPDGTASILAGTAGAAGFVNGTGTGAQFSSPRGVAVDTNGNVFVADAGNNAIRKITPNGDVSTYASGFTVPGPWGLCVDHQGNVVVADTYSHTIRKITPAGVVSILAGADGISGTQDGAAASARFNRPTGVAVDSIGNIYVADTANHAIRKLAPYGVVTTLAGGGASPGGHFGFVNDTGANALFAFPHGVAVDSEDNVYVADASNNAIRKVTPDGVVTTFAGAATAGLVNGSEATVRFFSPNGVAIDQNGNFYIADTLNNKIRKGVPDPTIPLFTTQPLSQTFAVGYSVTFTATAVGIPAPAYQWRKNGIDISGATGSSFTIANIAVTDAAGYTVVASNSVGSVTSTAAVLTVVPAVAPASATTGDFDNDGQSDLFWQNTVTGERSFWLMNGTTFKVGVSLGMFAPDWTIVGSGDFNHDGQTDLLWQNTITGERTIWLMNGTTFSLGVDLGTYSTDLRIMGSGDFNGDGQTDIVVENTISGEATIWLMNGTTKISEASLGIRPTAWSIAGTGDFNGDGKMDLVWQNAATGERTVWLMSGTTMSSEVSLGIVAKQFQIVGTGDYNRDGKTDLVWTDTSTGERSVWMMNGLVHSSTVALQSVSLEWSMDRPVFLTAQTAHADFNADGQTDVVWQNRTTGERTISFMNGVSITSTVSLGTTSTDWVISGTGDFNQDDKPDLVWTNTVTGERTVALMDGTTVLSNVPLTTISPVWAISAIGDFNYDGKPDIVWTNTVTGERSIWLMNGTVFGSGVSLGTVPTEWKIATTADLNGDGKADLVWQNTSTGESSVWLMNGGSFTAGIALDTLPVQWSIVGTGDFNEDGKADLVLQNTATGERVIRLMNRTTFLSSVSLGIYGTDSTIGN
jgi:hypothetical protein